jgi:hypothetical protein
MLEKLSERIVVGLVDYNQTDIIQVCFVLFDSIVQGLNHGNKTGVFALVGHFLYTAVDNFVFDPEFGEHVGGLFAQFDSMRQDQYFVMIAVDVLPGNLRKDDCFSTASRQLVKQVVFAWVFLDALKNLVDGTVLVIV